MSITRITRALVLLAIAIAVNARTVSANDDTLARAKGLYASAAYDEALALLDRLQSAPSTDETTSIAEYRVFCLLALERRDEARKNIDQILHANPHYLPSPDQASPRIQSVFRDVRRESLPKIVMERYGAAKAAFERKDPHAGQQFEEVLALLNDPDVQGAAMLSDLKEVASAFRDLTKALAASPMPTPKPELKASSQPPTFAAPEPADIIYTSADTDVTPPVAQSQRVPPWRPSPRETTKEFRGALRLLIDQSGAVVSASMPESTRPDYDQLLLRAARGWKFAPARKNGAPVRYLKLIEVQLRAAGQ